MAFGRGVHLKYYYKNNMEDEKIKNLRAFKRETKNKEKNSFVSGGTLAGQSKLMSVNKSFQKRKRAKIKISFEK